MESTISSAPESSTVTSSTVSLQVMPTHLLEINLISAQDLSPFSKSMRTYAVVWVQPNRKLSTRVDQQGHNNPTWNDKFIFRVDDEFLSSDASAVTIEIYNVSWFRDVLVGFVRVLINNLFLPSVRSQNISSMRFVALQIRRPSGTPQGILNMGVSLVNSTMRSMPLNSELGGSAVEFPVLTDKKTNNQCLEEKIENQEEGINSKVHLWRSLSVGTDVNNNQEEDFPLKPGSVCYGSVVNGGSELCSDVGPSASVVAAEIAKGLNTSAATATTKELTLRAMPMTQSDQTGSSILEDLTPEEAAAKGLTSNVERWKKERPPKHEKPQADTGHSRSHSDGGGLFSCFGNAYGFEVTIVCGASNNNSNNKTSSKNRKKPSDQNSI